MSRKHIIDRNKTFGREHNDPTPVTVSPKIGPPSPESQAHMLQRMVQAVVAQNHRQVVEHDDELLEDGMDDEASIYQVADSIAMDPELHEEPVKPESPETPEPSAPDGLPTTTPE